MLVADAKYVDHDQRPPRPGELYQLTVYGLAYKAELSRPILLFYPTQGRGDGPRATIGLSGSGTSLRLVAVPVTRLLSDSAVDPWQIPVGSELASERVSLESRGGAAGGHRTRP